MNIIFESNKKIQTIENNGVNYFLGTNQSGKTYILNQIKSGFSSQNKEFKVNGIQIDKNNYNVIYFDDTTDFSNEFKFTKNNHFRKIIYENIINELDEQEILDKVNIIFNKIDKKVNKLLDIKINSKTDNNIKFDIEINDINDIVDKFTNIYIDNYILNEETIPKSTRRKLIYELLLLKLDDSIKTNIVIIDNFDLYLDYDNTKKTINMIEEYAKNNNNTYFFLSTSNNIYEHINEKEAIYHTYKNNISKITDIKKIIEEALLYESYNKEHNMIDFETYKTEKAILFINEIDEKYKEIYNSQQHNIGKIYISNKETIEENYRHPKSFYDYLYLEINKEINKND